MALAGCHLWLWLWSCSAPTLLTPIWLPLTFPPNMERLKLESILPSYWDYNPSSNLLAEVCWVGGRSCWKMNNSKTSRLDWINKQYMCIKTSYMNVGLFVDLTIDLHTLSHSVLTTSASLFTGLELLYQPEVVRLYLSLLTCSHNHNTLEAAAGALQNLAAGHWAVSCQKWLLGFCRTLRPFTHISVKSWLLQMQAIHLSACSA